MESAAKRPAFARWIALLIALALLITQAPAGFAVSTVKVSLRASLTMGLAVGRNDTATLTATVKTTDGSAAPGVTWSSGRPSVVSVDSITGALTAHRMGTALIRAFAGTSSDVCVVTVRRLPVQALKLSRTRVSLFAKRDGAQLTATPVPANADNPSVTWSSSNTKVAAVDRATGFVTPLKPGVATIKCRAADGTQKKAYCRVTVKPVVPTIVTLSPSPLQVNVGGKATLTATVLPADATNKKVCWSSSNPSVATVSGGVVTGRNYGTAIITAKTCSGGIKAKCTVSVGYYTTTFRALVIGQENYVFGTLSGPHTDAGLVKSMLVNSDFGDGKNVDVKLEDDLTSSGIRNWLNQMASWGVDSDDVTYFYYSGHGSYDDPGALVGTDGGTVSVDEVRTYLDKLPGTVVVMLDSCYAGRYIKGKSVASISQAPSVDTDAVTSRVVSAFSEGTGLSAKTSLANSTTALGKYRILTACSSAEESYIIDDDRFQGSSLFTYYLATGCGVQAANWEDAGSLPADANSNRIVSLYELYRYTQPRVANNSALKQAHIKQTVRIWPAGSTFPVVQRTP
jgi:uncharacterized protein YjdB/uncharacterized caspase-like protein